jgi:hypothetical protein
MAQAGGTDADKLDQAISAVYDTVQNAVAAAPNAVS